MLQVKYFPFELPFEYPFTISKGTKTHQQTLIVSLGLGNITGYGEATAIAYYNVTIDEMIALVELKKQVIERYALTDPHRFWHFLHHLLPGNNFLIAALDIAGWDLFARMRRTPLKKLLGIPNRPGPLTDYTIGIDTMEKMLEKLKAHPWPVYKIKLRSADDIDVLAAIRAHTNAPLRVDANEAFSFEEALRLLPDFTRLGVTLIEQPLARSAWEEMMELKLKSTIPLFADESCVEEQDVAKCRNSFHGINIKLAKCGGITPAIRMITEARKLGLKTMMGSMNESTIGTAAVAHLIPVLDEVDADGPLLLKEDVGSGLRYDNGQIHTNDLPGLGTSFWGEQRENKNLSSGQ